MTRGDGYYGNRVLTNDRNFNPSGMTQTIDEANTIRVLKCVHVSWQTGLFVLPRLLLPALAHSLQHRTTFFLKNSIAVVFRNSGRFDITAAPQANRSSKTKQQTTATEPPCGKHSNQRRGHHRNHLRSRTILKSAHTRALAPTRPSGRTRLYLRSTSPRTWPTRSSNLDPSSSASNVRVQTPD